MTEDYPSQIKVHDEVSRLRKAQKILTVLENFLGPNLSQFSCLDVGCSSGLISIELAGKVKTITALDVDFQSIRLATQRKSPANIKFLVSDATRLPFADQKFDLVICAQVYEHVGSAVQLVSEVSRVLKAGGLCFFSGPNKLALIEEHYGLPFVSWLPRAWADVYLRVAGRGEYYREHPLTYWQLRKLWTGFEIHDYTAELIRHPHRFSCVEELGRMVVLTRHIPAWVWQLARPLFPNYNWVLVKQ